jgi:hypothetical protein
MVESLPTEVPAPTSHEVAACAFEAWADTFRSQGFNFRLKLRVLTLLAG